MGFELRKPYHREESRIVFSTEAAGLRSHGGAGRARQTPAEIRAAEEIMAVVKKQPHRRGSDDPALSEPMGRFCVAQWPPNRSPTGEDVNAGWRVDMFRAGSQYLGVVHQHRVLLGLGAGAHTVAEGLSCSMNEEQIAAACEAARIKRTEADGVLSNVHPRGVSAMVRLCVDRMDPLPRDEDLSRHCLYALAVHFEIIKPGFHPEG